MTDCRVKLFRGFAKRIEQRDNAFMIPFSQYASCTWQGKIGQVLHLCIVQVSLHKKHAFSCDIYAIVYVEGKKKNINPQKNIIFFLL